MLILVYLRYPFEVLWCLCVRVSAYELSLVPKGSLCHQSYQIRFCCPCSWCEIWCFFHFNWLHVLQNTYNMAINVNDRLHAKEYNVSIQITLLKLMRKCSSVIAFIVPFYIDCSMELSSASARKTWTYGFCVTLLWDTRPAGDNLHVDARMASMSTRHWQNIEHYTTYTIIWSFKWLPEWI